MIVSGTNLKMTRGDSECLLVTISGYEVQPGDKLEMTVRSYVGGKVYAYREELDVLKDPHLNASAMAGYEVAIEPEMLLRDGEKLEIAGFVFRVIYTPGHTKGGCCYYEEKEKALFSGDTIFMESIGRTDLPTGNTAQLLDSVRNKVLVLPDDVKIYPGHGPETTVAYEAANNPYA